MNKNHKQIQDILKFITLINKKKFSEKEIEKIFSAMLSPSEIQTLSQRIFKQVYHKEILTNKVIKDWFDLLQPTVDQLNKEKTRLTGIEPNIAIDMKNVEQHHRIEFDSNKKFNIDDIVRYKVQSDLVHDKSRSHFNN